MAGPTKNSEGGKKMSKNEIPKQNPKQKKGLTNALKYFFGVGDAGFVLMSNIETFYFMTFLTDLAGFAAGVAGVINSVFMTIPTPQASCSVLALRRNHQWHKSKEMGALSFLADHGSVDGAVSVRIHVHTCQ